MSDHRPADQRCACGHPDRYHFDDGKGFVRCRWNRSCKCAKEIEVPLFVPLRGEHFDAFDAGTKDTEYRADGPRWNPRTCRVGRRVTLSRGYGKARRLNGVIVGVELVPWRRAPAVFKKIYPTADRAIAIHIEVTR
jgi:hypothetical protein